MNYLSSFLNWSNEPTENNSTHTHHQPKYVSPLSALQKLEPYDDNDSQPSLLASALFSGWGSSSSLPSHKHQPPGKQNNASYNGYNPYASMQPYNLDLPSITQHQPSVIMPPPSHPSAPVSVTASPPPPMMHHNPTYNTKKRSNSLKNQIKFTPNYKKKRSHTLTHTHDTRHTPLVLPSHSVSQKPTISSTAMDLHTITESIPVTPARSIPETHNTKSSLIDALQFVVDADDIIHKPTIDTPPPRAPLQPFTYTTPPNTFNEMLYENDIVRPHDGYNNTKPPLFQYQSITESVKSVEEMADASNSNTKDDMRNHLMVSVLDGAYSDTPDTPPPFEFKQHSGNHLAPIHRGALPHLQDADEDEETNEVNLLYNKEDVANLTLDTLFGFNVAPSPSGLRLEGEHCDTNSVVSDFEEAGVLLNKSAKKQNKIRVTCNNCYLWRHHTNTLQIDVDNLRQRTKALEQNINVAEDNVQYQSRYYDDLKEDNERLKHKNNELKSQIAKQNQEAMDALIEARKTKETETKLINKDYQNVMKQRNELELNYNETVNTCNDKDAQIEKYKNELHSMQLKYDRLNYGIIGERNALNMKEKELKHNLDEMKGKYMNVQKEHKQSMDALQSKNNAKDECINTLSDDNSTYQLRISHLHEECKRLKVELESVREHEGQLMEEKQEIEERLYETENDIKTLKINEKKWKSKYMEKEQFKQEKQHEINPQKVDQEKEKQIDNLHTKYNVLQTKNDEKCEILSAETTAQKDKYTKIYNELVQKKAKYDELKTLWSEKEDDLNGKVIEYNSLNEKYQRLMAEMNRYKEKNDALSTKLETSENECIDIKSKLSSSMEDKEVKIMEIGDKLNNIEDELTETKDENQRLVKMKDKGHAQFIEIEEQLKQSNQENDKLLDQNYELNEKLSKTIEEMDDYKNSLYALKNDKTDYNEKVQILSKKYKKAMAEIEKQSKKNVRLNTQVESLHNENKGLHDSIDHLESVIDDTYGLAENKERMVNHLKRKNNENQLNLDSLKKRMKKHERQKTSYRQMEVDKVSKSHRKMDQKLDNLRRSNMTLQTENDELHQKIKELNRDINDLKSEVTETKTKFKSTVSKYESDISKITANNNKIMSDQINLEAELDGIKEENNRLTKEVDAVKNTCDDMTQKYNMIRQKISYDVDARRYLIELNVKEDEMYQFTNRCRNIFINTNRLTPNLIRQLIESCHRSIVVFHQSKSRFAHFITKCDGIHERFLNLEQSIVKKYTRTGTIVSGMEQSFAKTPVPALVTKQKGKGVTKLRTASSSWGDLKAGYPNIDYKAHNFRKSTKKHKMKGANKIRKPIQEIKPPHLEAYNQIYLLSLTNLANAKNDMLDIAEMYQKPLDYACYEYDDIKDQNEDDDMHLDDDDVPWIDWDRLSVHPSLERYEMEEMMKNNERFIATIKKLQTSTKKLRTLHAKTGVELNVAWHSYYLSPAIADATHVKNDHDKEIDDYSVEDDMNSDLEMDSEYLALVKKVNKSGPLKKRFSIM